MSKKVNPRRRPVTEADLKRAKKIVMVEAVRYAFAIIFTVLADKEGYDLERMSHVWRETEKLSMSVKEGYVSITDLANALKREYGVNLLLTGEDEAGRQSDENLTSEAAGLLLDPDL